MADGHTFETSPTWTVSTECCQKYFVQKLIHWFSQRCRGRLGQVLQHKRQVTSLAHACCQEAPRRDGGCIYHHRIHSWSWCEREFSGRVFSSVAVNIFHDLQNLGILCNQGRSDPFSQGPRGCCGSKDSSQ